jgi:hypothetical protein
VHETVGSYAFDVYLTKYGELERLCYRLEVDNDLRCNISTMMLLCRSDAVCATAAVISIFSEPRSSLLIRRVGFLRVRDDLS